MYHLRHHIEDCPTEVQKLATIEQVYIELSNPTHPVSIAMARMQDVEEVRIIERRG